MLKARSTAVEGLLWRAGMRGSVAHFVQQGERPLDILYHPCTISRTWVQYLEQERCPVEGPSLREYPRMVLDKPVELRVEKKAIKVKEAGNLSVSGLYVEGQKLPVGTAVH